MPWRHAHIDIQSTYEEDAPALKKELPKAIPDDIKAIVTDWKGIIASAQQPAHTYLKNAGLSLGEGNQLVIVFEDGIAYDYFRQPDNQAHLENMISNFVQKEVSVQIQNISDGSRFEENYIDLSKVINMDIEIVN